MAVIKWQHTTRGEHGVWSGITTYSNFIPTPNSFSAICLFELMLIYI